ncbi:MAG: transketolase [Candidatus Wildermuthbacteria bacterium]|nr:transketolase [Candidatus Wildermuthbacteria bacterium]
MLKEKEIFLRKKANYIRDEIMRVAVQNGAGHIAPSLSCVDVLIALYFECMSYDPKNPLSPDRDRLIFSKAHGCYGLYAILADLGVMPKEEWDNFYIEGKSSLCGCSKRKLEYGLEADCGSLGHGLPMAVGLAFGAQLQKKNYHTFCLVGDGEMQEGTAWEALQFAVKHDLRNLIVIVDSNGLQAMDFIVNIMDKGKDDLFKRLRGFGLSPVICPGHDAVKLADCLKAAKESSEDMPKVILAQTVKGFGFKCMEGAPKFHFRLPTNDDLNMGRNYE